MDWLLFACIVLAGLLVVGGLMLRLRTEATPRRMPPWLAASLMVVSGTLLVVSLIGQYWLSAASFALNSLLWAMLLVNSRRAGAS